MSLIEIGQALSSSRRAAGLTQKAAAQSAGLSQGTVSRYESGDLDASLSSLLLLARTYNCTLSALVAGSLQHPEKVSEVTAPAKATR
jgi:transcriptional regulator with XRE-family HTH domain